MYNIGIINIKHSINNISYLKVGLKDSKASYNWTYAYNNIRDYMGKN